MHTLHILVSSRYCRRDAHRDASCDVSGSAPLLQTEMVHHSVLPRKGLSADTAVKTVLPPETRSCNLRRRRASRYPKPAYAGENERHRFKMLGIPGFGSRHTRKGSQTPAKRRLVSPWTPRSETRRWKCGATPQSWAQNQSPTILCFTSSSTAADAAIRQGQSSDGKSASPWRPRSLRLPSPAEPIARRKGHRITTHSLRTIDLAGDGGCAKTTNIATMRFCCCLTGSVGSQRWKQSDLVWNWVCVKYANELKELWGMLVSRW